ncbi:MAG: glycogen synthase [Elusimicrobia bacterium]|nr:glycogen synthase [Elusimicrobiota bacterium]
MKIAITSFECVPFVKVGGLADVAGTLPGFIKKKGIDVRLFLPLHKKIDRKKHRIKPMKQKLLVPVGDHLEEGYVWQAKLHGSIPVYFIENEKYFGRDDIYRTSTGDHPDNPFRFVFFSRAVLECCKSVDFKPDVIHCNDMQTGLIPAYLKTLYRIDAFFSRAATVYTIHNIAYQGIYPVDVYPVAGFGWEDFVPAKFEYFGQMNFMKAGIVYSDKITTVSPTYANEIRTTNHHGRGLEGVLAGRQKDLTGVINGIDYKEWDPSADAGIKARYSVSGREGKGECKRDLQETLNLPVSEVAVLAMVSRLDCLKGIDILCEISEKLLQLPVQLVILGTGDKAYHDLLTVISKKYPKKFSLNLRFDNPLAHKIYAGSDVFLMPSMTEPCGLGQMIAMRYGTIPVVHRTGGLADSVAEFDPSTKKGTGFLFSDYKGVSLYGAIKKALDIFRNNEEWPSLVNNAMKHDFSWDKPVKEYVKVYRSAIKK